MELGKKKKNTKLIRIIDIRDYGRNHELFCSNNLLLRTARKPGDIERVNHTVLGCLNRAGVKYEIIDENKKNDIMKIKINESQLKRIISESVKKVLRESYNDDDVYMYNYRDAMSDRHGKSWHDDTDREGYLEEPNDIDADWAGFDEDEDNNHSWELFNNKSIAHGVGSGYTVSKRGIPSDIERAQSDRKGRKRDWNERELRTGNKSMSKWIGGKHDLDDIDDDWDIATRK